jgi:hypothetical protein
LKFFPLHRSGSDFVQSGFYEVALMPALRATLCHATSQNPLDSQINAILIQHCEQRRFANKAREPISVWITYRIFRTFRICGFF